ncbi:MAG: flagellar brake protein [Gallionella sp.]
MNLQPVSLEAVPIGRPLPWRLYDRNGYILFARGELVASREQLESLLNEGLMLDLDAPPQIHENGDWAGFNEVVPLGLFPPNGIKPQPGEPVQLRLMNRNQQTYFSARLVGYIKNMSILVTTPMVAGTPLIMADGEPVEVRMVTGNNIYVFQTAIQRLCTSPTHYMHLNHPAEVRVQRLRKSPWAKVNFGVNVTDAQGGHEVASIVNLSPDGAHLRAPRPLGETGKVLRISFHATMDELGATLKIDGKIKHVYAPNTSRVSVANMLEYGIAFNNVSAADSLWLKALVYRHIAEGLLA